MVKKSQLIRVIEVMYIGDLMTILRFLNTSGIKIVESNEGSHINLDSMDTATYFQLVELVEELNDKKKEIDLI